MSNTRPPTRVWSPKDEALLTEMIERRERIMAERREPLFLFEQTVPVNHSADDFTNWFIANAQALRNALAPFGGRAEKYP